MSRKMRSGPDASAEEEKLIRALASGEKYKSPPAPLTPESRHVPSARRPAHVTSSSNQSQLPSRARARARALALPVLVETGSEDAKSKPPLLVDAGDPDALKSSALPPLAGDPLVTPSLPSHCLLSPSRPASSPHRHCLSPPSPSRPKNLRRTASSSASPLSSSPPLCLSLLLVVTPSLPLSPPRRHPLSASLTVVAPVSAARRQLPAQRTPQPPCRLPLPLLPRRLSLPLLPCCRPQLVPPPLPLFPLLPRRPAANCVAAPPSSPLLPSAVTPLSASLLQPLPQTVCGLPLPLPILPC